MNQVATRRVVPGAWAAALLAAVVSGVVAAPTTQLDDSEVAAPSRNAEMGVTGVTRPRAANAAGLWSTDQSLHPETSTGNKNLDLLLELQGRPGEEPRQVARRSAAAASAAAAALAGLRAEAAERLAQQRPAADQAAARPVVLPFEGMGMADGQGRSALPPTERREWTHQLGGGAGSIDSRRDAYRSDDRESNAIRGAYSDDNRLRRLPQEVIAFLRENRFWVLGGIGLLLLLGAALKAYSRRI